MSLSNYAENLYLNYIFSTVKWVGLSTANPKDDGSGLAEPSGNAYIRVEVPSSYWAAASGGSKSNNTAITFPTATGSWGTVTYVVIFDAASGGNIVASEALDNSLVVVGGVTPNFAISALAITLD